MLLFQTCTIRSTNTVHRHSQWSRFHFVHSTALHIVLYVLYMYIYTHVLKVLHTVNKLCTLRTHTIKLSYLAIITALSRPPEPLRIFVCVYFSSNTIMVLWWSRHSWWFESNGRCFLCRSCAQHVRRLAVLCTHCRKHHESRNIIIQQSTIIMIAMVYTCCKTNEVKGTGREADGLQFVSFHQWKWRFPFYKV